MQEKPILILQMQRMGDLVLSFPLMGWLKSVLPQHPLWVVGEPLFFESLLALAPEAVYYSYDSASALTQTKYKYAINLSHRSEAALLAGQCSAERHFGAYTDSSGATYVHGNWQLYRKSLVLSNRYNKFHWADLNALDVIQQRHMFATSWPEPRKDDSWLTKGRVGLFLGASEEGKRPSADFWVELTKNLIRRGLKPVLLGGTAERTLGIEVAGKLNSHAINLTGHFSLKELVSFMGTLQLLVSPDTGPMHVAAWTHVPTLNLSMGSVNAWETAPFAPNHWVLRSNMSCVGCWECKFDSFVCHKAFSPHVVAKIADSIIAGKIDSLKERPFKGVTLLQTKRGKQGLFHMEPLWKKEATARELLTQFWQEFFSAYFSGTEFIEMEKTWQACQQKYPALAAVFHKRIYALRTDLVKQFALLKKTQQKIVDDAFFEALTPLVQPLSGYISLHLANEDYSLQGWHKMFDLLEKLCAVLQKK